ncbi:hypothetical protein CJ030_MR8G022034 [Morella rubra]|uniref:Uncharacterized protein n=1 Tax=Morella rubra TaxID=262757 RepID=A0A6A1UQA8_9ROSI|nr:hypothetical protein CJ030_MR8G022034 [Morella rubra]
MEQLTHWVDSYDVTVRDVTITFSAQRIAEFLGLPRPEGPTIPELEDLAPLQPFDLFRLCTESGENVPGAPHIVHKTLNDFFRMLHLIMAYNIDPRKCTTESTFERARLMVRLVRGVPMDLPGTKSFARKRHELLGAVQIDEVGPADLYAASHKRKNGEWICDAARMNFEKMMEVEAQATMEGRTLTDVEVFTQVLGEKRGYVRGLGDSVRPVSTSCSSSSADMARRLTETQLELEQIRADREKESQEQMHEIHSLQQKMEEMQERMAQYDRFMSRFASGAFDDVGV